MFSTTFFVSEVPDSSRRSFVSRQKFCPRAQGAYCEGVWKDGSGVTCNYKFKYFTRDLERNTKWRKYLRKCIHVMKNKNIVTCIMFCCDLNRW